MAHHGSLDQYTAIGFKVTDPVSGSTQDMESSGAVPSPSAYPHARNELARLGTSVPAVAPSPYPPNYYGGGYAGSADTGCSFMDQPMPCDLAEQLGEDYVKDKIEQGKKKKQKEKEKEKKKKDDLLGPPVLKPKPSPEEDAARRAAAAANPVGADEGESDNSDTPLAEGNSNARSASLGLGSKLGPIDKLATSLLRLINPTSNAEDLEYTFAICRNLADGSLAYNGFHKGQQHGSDPGECPQGTTMVAYGHTHGAYSGPPIDDETFSP